MNTSGKIVITLGIASGALFAAWLLTGKRKVKTRQFVARKARTVLSPFASSLAPRDAIKSRKVVVSEEQEIYYI